MKLGVAKQDCKGDSGGIEIFIVTMFLNWAFTVWSE